MERKLHGWDEADVGAAREKAPVGVRRLALPHGDSICRTAVYVTRLYGGVGGGSRICANLTESIICYQIL